jgi:G:T-mismatch repair DNA endonuclease (very short patch repair protein)
MGPEEHFQPGAASQHAMAELATSNLFSELPPEMRLRVWKQVLPIRPQIIKVGKCCVCPTICCYWHNAEVRPEALENHEVGFGKRVLHLALFNFSQDRPHFR